MRPGRCRRATGGRRREAGSGSCNSRHLGVRGRWASVAAPAFDPGQAIAHEGEDAQHAILRAVVPFLDPELASVVFAEAVANLVAKGRLSAFLLPLEGAVAEADQLTAATQGFGLV